MEWGIDHEARTGPKLRCGKRATSYEPVLKLETLFTSSAFMVSVGHHPWCLWDTTPIV
jgi:hypothetical protein